MSRFHPAVVDRHWARQISCYIARVHDRAKRDSHEYTGQDELFWLEKIRELIVDAVRYHVSRVEPCPPSHSVSSLVDEDLYRYYRAYQICFPAVLHVVSACAVEESLECLVRALTSWAQSKRPSLDDHAQALAILHCLHQETLRWCKTEVFSLN